MRPGWQYTWPRIMDRPAPSNGDVDFSLELVQRLINCCNSLPVDLKAPTSSLLLLRLHKPAVLFITPPSPGTYDTTLSDATLCLTTLRRLIIFTTAKYTKDIDPFFPTCFVARGRHGHHRFLSRHRVSYSATWMDNTYPTCSFLLQLTRSRCG